MVRRRRRAAVTGREATARGRTWVASSGARQTERAPPRPRRCGLIRRPLAADDVDRCLPGTGRRPAQRDAAFRASSHAGVRREPRLGGQRARQRVADHRDRAPLLVGDGASSRSATTLDVARERPGATRTTRPRIGLADAADDGGDLVVGLEVDERRCVRSQLQLPHGAAHGAVGGRCARRRG